jgi:hypothetical protein
MQLTAAAAKAKLEQEKPGSTQVPTPLVTEDEEPDKRVRLARLLQMSLFDGKSDHETIIDLSDLEEKVSFFGLDFFAWHNLKTNNVPVLTGKGSSQGARKGREGKEECQGEERSK